MKKYILPVVTTLSLFCMISCSTKFKIDAPYKNITVIYAFLDRADTAHYIRIEKAFLDENKSALTLAQIADSSFYTNINVRIEQIDFLHSGNIFDTFHLNRVDLNQEGYPKQSGVFFNAPNYAYKFKNTLDPNFSYRIVVTNLITGEVDSAEAPIIDDNGSSSFYVTDLDNQFANLAGLGFGPTSSFSVLEITANYSTFSGYNFYNQTSPVSVGEAVIRFNWLDSNFTTGAQTENYFDYDAGLQVVGSNGFDLKIPDLALYNAIASGIGPAPVGVGRLIQACDLTVYFGTPDFYNYQQNVSIQGSGLTANEIEPIYTNIKGANALGLFTSRGSRTGKISITSATIDSLESNSITSAVNIVGVH